VRQGKCNQQAGADAFSLFQADDLVCDPHQPHPPPLPHYCCHCSHCCCCRRP